MRTERLFLRQWRASDLDAYATMLADPDVSRFLGDGSPADRHLAWRGMTSYAGAWALQGFGHWAVELAATGEFIGRVGPWYPEGWPALEIGWAIDPRHQGRGYATEAGRVALDCAWTQLGAGRVVSLVRPGNAASAAVAQKLGAVLATTIEFFGAPAEVYDYPSPG